MKELSLKRKPISLVAGLVSGVVLFAVSAVFYLGSSDRPTSERLLVILWPLAFGVATLVSVISLARPFLVQVDEAAVRVYRNGRLRRSITWNEVAWVSYGTRSTDVAFLIGRKSGTSLFICARKRLQSVGVDDVVHNLPKAALVEFANSVVDIARSHSIP